MTVGQFCMTRVLDKCREFTHSTLYMYTVPGDGGSSAANLSTAVYDFDGQEGELSFKVHMYTCMYKYIHVHVDTSIHCTYILLCGSLLEPTFKD